MNTYRIWFSNNSAILIDAETETDARAHETTRDIVYKQGLKIKQVETLSKGIK